MSGLTASVVIPAYNHETFIEEALHSALAEPVDEVVVVDDGSTDATRSHLRACTDPRLVRVEQENQGAHAALNRGVALARGDVVFVLNSDDAFVPGRVAACLESFAADSALAWVATWIEVIDGAGASLGIKEAWHNMPPWAPRGAPTAGLGATDDPVLALLESNYVATTSNVAFRRTLTSGSDPLCFQPLRYAHDWDFELAACRRGGFALIEQPLVRYRVHDSNTIREGREAERGQGLMRFEALWSIIRHAHALEAAAVSRGFHPEDLARRRWQARPPWAPDALIAQLQALRGADGTTPGAYRALLDPRHPFRQAAIERLAHARG